MAAVERRTSARRKPDASRREAEGFSTSADGRVLHRTQPLPSSSLKSQNGLLSRLKTDGSFRQRGFKPMYESETYRANLCPLCGRVELADLGEDFGEPVREPIEAASRRAI